MIANTWPWAFVLIAYAAIGLGYGMETERQTGFNGLAVAAFWPLFVLFCLGAWIAGGSET